MRPTSNAVGESEEVEVARLDAKRPSMARCGCSCQVAAAFALISPSSSTLFLVGLRLAVVEAASTTDGAKRLT